jgi:uncharacterized protein YjbI with pentapeptide repeats
MDISEIKNLQGANLIGANLQGANFVKANLTKANLQGSNFRGSNLPGSSLQGADFQWSNLYRAKNLSLDQLSKVKTLHGVKLDEELLIALKEKYPALLEKPE